MQTTIPILHDTRLTLGEALLILRRRHGLTIQQLAEQAGVSPKVVSRLEHDDLGVTVSDTVALFAALGLFLRVVFHQIPPERPAVEEEE